MRWSESRDQADGRERGKGVGAQRRKSSSDYALMGVQLVVFWLLLWVTRPALFGGELAVAVVTLTAAILVFASRFVFQLMAEIGLTDTQRSWVCGLLAIGIALGGGLGWVSARRHYVSKLDALEKHSAELQRSIDSTKPPNLTLGMVSEVKWTDGTNGVNANFSVQITNHGDVSIRPRVIVVRAPTSNLSDIKKLYDVVLANEIEAKSSMGYSFGLGNLHRQLIIATISIKDDNSGEAFVQWLKVDPAARTLMTPSLSEAKEFATHIEPMFGIRLIQ